MFTWDRHNVIPLVQQPSKRELPRSAIVLLSQKCQSVKESLVFLQILTLEAWILGLLSNRSPQFSMSEQATFDCPFNTCRKINFAINSRRWNREGWIHLRIDSLSLLVSQQQLSQRRILVREGCSTLLRFQAPCRIAIGPLLSNWSKYGVHYSLYENRKQ